MATSSHAVTADELFRMPSGKVRYELVRGELRPMSPAGSEHGVVTMELAMRLAAFVKQDHLGVVFGAETGFQLEHNPDTVLAPDIAVVGQARIPASGIPKGYWPGAPDLAVEVASPSDSEREMNAKAIAWLTHGAREVWVVDARHRTVAIHSAGKPAVVLNESDQLEGGSVAPGFACQVGELFPATSA
ncbi:MAG TPA: Uma2 family endonuclease [Pirellulales bacterium]|nr:Uma2 family endonuclease [Pirellulales bacterium]